MSDATTKEGHVNYDVSDVLVEARAAPTMGRGCYGWVTAQDDDAKNRHFFRWERAEAEARYTPRRRDRRYRARREGSWEGRGGESCWRGRQRRALWRTRGVTTMEIAPSCGAIYGILAVWRKNYRGDPKTRNSRFTVAWRSVAPLPLWSQNREHDVVMSSNKCQGGRFLMRRRLTKSARRGEASATRRGVILGLRAPVLGKKHVELFLGLYDS